MGQYYYPTLFKQKGKRLYSSQFYAHEFGATTLDNGYIIHHGLKLTEHSYVGNSFVETVLTQLFNNPQRVYWCGDYFEKDDFENPEDYNRMVRTWKNFREDGKGRKYNHPEEVQDFSGDKFIVNHTKKCFIDMSKYCKKAPTATEDDDCHFHPLCLLTAVGNGRGGGDYSGINEEDVGIWAGDLIEIKANRLVIPEDYRDVTKNIGFQETYR